MMRKIIHNAHSRERFEFIRTADETFGEMVEYEWTLPPKAGTAHTHSHPFQSEVIEVLEGEVSIHIYGVETRLHAGERLIIPMGSPHRCQNATAAPARALITLQPALDAELMIVALGADDDDDTVQSESPLRGSQSHLLLSSTYVVWPDAPVLS
jgi:quercetin dioxygenase-like cupin family protein